MQWRPSPTGRLLTRSIDWQLTLEDEAFELVYAGNRLQGSVIQLEAVQIKNGLL